MIQIQLATPQHSAALARLACQTFVDAFGKDNNEADLKAYVDEAFREDTLKRELADPAAAFYLAVAGNEWLGYAKLRRGALPDQLTERSAVELQRIYVHQHALGQGIGAQLMQTAIDYAQQHKYKALWLGVWERNPSAIAFYQRWGFTQFGTHTFMIGQDAQTDWLMQRRI